MSVWENNYDDEIYDERIMDDSYVEEKLINESLSESRRPKKKAKDQPLHIDVSKLKSLGKFKRVSDIFKEIEHVINNLSNASMSRALVRSAQDILDGYVRGNDVASYSAGGDGFAFNSYRGALMHSYYASVVIGGKRLKTTWRVSNKIAGKWGKASVRKYTKRKKGVIRTVNGKRVFKILKRRHSTYVTKRNIKWTAVQHHDNISTGNYGLRHHTKDIPMYGRVSVKRRKNGKTEIVRQRLMYNDYLLNARGRRLKGKKDSRGRRRWRWQSNDFESIGHKRGTQTFYGGNFRDYVKKERVSHEHTYKDRDTFRYYHTKYDDARYGGRSGFKKNTRLSRKSRQCVEIFNASPYAAHVENLGYRVLPAAKVRNVYGKKIAQLMKKDFDKFLK